MRTAACREKLTTINSPQASVRLDFHSLLPSHAVIDTARESDASRARELCGGLKSGEIVVFDRGHQAHGASSETGFPLVFLSMGPPR